MNLSFDMPLFTQKQGQEIPEIKNYLYRLTEQLRYILSNLDGDNFSGELTDELKAELNNSYAALKASTDRISGELAALNRKIKSVTEAGTAVLNAEGKAEIEFTDNGNIPAIAVCFTDSVASDCAVTVHSVTNSTAEILSVGVPEGTRVRWTAIYNNT